MRGSSRTEVHSPFANSSATLARPELLGAQQSGDSTQQTASTPQPAPIKHFNLKGYAHVGGPVSAPEAIRTTPSDPSPEAKAEADKKMTKKEVTVYLLIGISEGALSISSTSFAGLVWD